MLEDKIKKFLKEKIRIKDFIIYLIPLIIIVLALIKVPYYITLGGGSIDVDDRIKINGEYKSKGSFGALYVSEMRGNVLFYLLSYVVPSYERIKISKVVYDNEDASDYDKREKIYFDNSTDMATLVAYQKAGKSVSVTNNNYKVTYISKDSKTNLKIGDKLLKIDNNVIKEYKDIENNIKNKKINDTVLIEVLRDGKKEVTNSTLIDIEGLPKLGIYISNNYSYKLDPKMKLNFDKKQEGPSGGLITALTIYNKLVKEDITKGKKIVGTGTINKDGLVGPIGGVKYKLSGAAKEKADIVLVPEENYKESVKELNKHKYKFKLIGVKTFDEALDKLK